jgi:hypothetical protein
LSKVDLYNPGPSQIVDDIMEKDKKAEWKNWNRLNTHN